MSYNFMKFMPCNECCECTRFVDNFDCREYLTDGEWEILSGSWNLVRADPDEHYGFIRWTWGVEAQCETAEGPDELTVVKWVRTESHRYGATVVGTFNPFHIVADFWTGFGFSVGDQVDVRFAALCNYADWCRYIVTAIEGYRVALYDPTESNAYPNPNDDYVLTSRGSCLWDYTVDDATIAANVILRGSEYKIRVTLSGYASAFGGQFAVNDVWEKSYGETPPNCCSISGDVLNWVSSSGDYDSSSSTCTLTASGSCNQYCEHCAGDEPPNAPYYFNVSISGMVPAKSVTVRQVLAKLGTAGTHAPVPPPWDPPPLLTVYLYEGHGFIVNDRVTVNLMTGFVTSAGGSSIVVQWISGGIPAVDDPVTVTPIILLPCVKSRKPSGDGTTIGEMSLVAAWPDNVLEGSGKIRLTREIDEENFYIDAPAIRASGESNEDRTYRLYFGCPNQNLTGGYYVEWKAVWKTSETGILTTRTDCDTGVVTLDTALPIEVGDEVNVGGRTNMEVTSVSGLLIGVGGGSGGALPAEDSEVMLTRLDSQAFYGPSGLMGSVTWKSSLSLSACVWTNLKEDKVVYMSSIPKGLLLGVTSLPGTEIGFESVQTGQLSSFAVTKRQDECPECSQICEACFGGTVPSCLRVTFQDGCVFYLEHTGGCNWQQVCFVISATLSSIDDYYYLTLTAACGGAIASCGYRAGTYRSDSLGPSDEETVTPGASSSIVHGTQKEGTYAKCEFDDDDRWVITGANDGLEVVCMFNLTELRRATDLAVDCHFLRGVYHSNSVAINDGTHVLGAHSDTHEEDASYYTMTNEIDNGDEEIDIQFDTTIPASRIPGTLTVVGRYVSEGEGQVHCYAYNYGTSDWDSIGSFSDAADDETKEFDFADAHTDGAGNVLVRFASVDGLDEDGFRVDFLEVVCKLKPTSIEVYVWNYDTGSYDRLPNDCQPTQMSAVEANTDQTYTYNLSPDHTNVADGEVKVRFLTVGGSPAGDELHLDYAAVTGEFKIDCLALDEELTHTTIPDCTCQVTAVDGDDCKYEEEWDTVTWIEHTVDGGVITKTNHEGPYKTYWVNSVSGGGSEAGSGTEVNPWTNLNTVFSDACIRCLCTTACCPKVKVLVKGTIDYIVGGSGFNFQRNLVIEPWGTGAITISISGNGNFSVVHNCVGIIWKNTDLIVTITAGNSSVKGFSSCPYSTFDACTTTIIGTEPANSTNIYGFTFCSYSIFDACTSITTATAAGDYGHAYGFSTCGYSTFNTCIGTATASGFYAYGFLSCSNSIFDNCTGEGITSEAGNYAWAFGFHKCSNSTFDACHGKSDIPGSPTNGCACGFYENTGANFNNCITSDSVCFGTGCFGTGCPTNCDI